MAEIRYLADEASGVPAAGVFPLAAGGKVADLYVSDGDHPGVIRATGDLQQDLFRVTGVAPRLCHQTEPLSEYAVLIGTIGKSAVIDGLIASGRLDAEGVAGKWESFVVQTVPEPLPGVKEALVIAGSDKRGTIYGIYDLSGQIGVSPWHWWADVPVRRRPELYIRRGTYKQGEPTVKYRGIFLNDEGPSLMTWVRSNYPDFTHEFYERVFELLLRLRANFLWPAMWDSSFYEDDEQNAAVADLYGIVIGTSHHEPMLRPHKDWKKRREGPWDYAANRDTLYRFWEEGIVRSRNYESIITLGMRGDGDEPMGGGEPLEEKMRLLQTIIADQREIIARHMSPDVTKVPQIWAIYKEVQEYYERGMRVPDDVILLWSDDNHGNLRRVPSPEERGRAGGAGIYYHLDYVGNPRSYKWIATVPVPKIWEQMHKAFAYGADRLWVVNVGDLKPMEFQTEFFLRLAWNVHDFAPDNLREFGNGWAMRQFGAGRAAADEIADLIARYAKWNGRIKPELLNAVPLYSWVHYKEAETVLADMRDAVVRAERLYAELPDAYRDAFFQTVLYPVKASAVVNELHLRAEKSKLYARQGRAMANTEARRAELLFETDEELAFDYNRRTAMGKWNHMMDQTHIGYTGWNQPETNVMPETGRVPPLPGPAMGVAVEGSESAWPGAADECALPPFDPHSRERRYIDVFNRGSEPFAFTVKADGWILPDVREGVVVKQKRIWVDVDRDAAPPGERAEGTVTIIGSDGTEAAVRVRLVRPAGLLPPASAGETEAADVFVESDGHISIEAEHFAANVPAGGASWRKIEDYGRTLSSMAVFPVTVPSARPPEGSPRLEYRVRLASAGDIRVICHLAPSLDFVPGAGLRIGVSFDDGPIVIADAMAHGADSRPHDGIHDGKDWEKSVILNVRTVETVHRIDAPGDHTLRVWMVDPTVVLQKIVLDAGGVRPSFLGPPESARAGKPEANAAAASVREKAAAAEAAFDPYDLPGRVRPVFPLVLREDETWEADVFVHETGVYGVRLLPADPAAPDAAPNAADAAEDFRAVLEIRPLFPERWSWLPEIPPVRLGLSDARLPAPGLWLPAGEHRLRMRVESGTVRLGGLAFDLAGRDTVRVRPTLRRENGDEAGPFIAQIGLFNDGAYGRRYDVSVALRGEDGSLPGSAEAVGCLARGGREMLQLRLPPAPGVSRLWLCVSLRLDDGTERHWRYPVREPRPTADF
ncbi:MAG TPA: glycosyl hydrolase 115 family protein [Paenibacillaceae bacterium]